MGIHLKIKEERKKNNMTQEKLAEEVGVSTKTITKWEAGDVIPSLENCKKLRAVFEITLDYLLKDNIELKSTYDKYVELGEKILELVEEEYPIDFIQNYYICAREPNLLFPRKIAKKFINDIGKRIDKTDASNNEEIKLIQKDMKTFLLFWYKYNKGKHLLLKDLKAKTLYMNSVSYDAKEVAEALQSSNTQKKSILLLRNLIIGKLIKECDLFNYELDEEIKSEVDYSGEIMWPLNVYK
ncbi:helix-turn-helix domain-containing protein [Listeria costaricensis]|uniref:helix-turn-helix domain-containing protein n=1 Tax=Listeria costaricensis TaxID=2026604 RepID=UPI000C08A48E|nr:helix-turn-helix transcriptional regulator [Listeria costaricensis]